MTLRILRSKIPVSLFNQKKQNTKPIVRGLCSKDATTFSIDESPSDRPEFPGSRSKFTTELKFLDSSSYETIPTFRVLDQSGNFLLDKFSNSVDLNLIKKIYRGKVKF